jgi:hypothetical protein
VCDGLLSKETEREREKRQQEKGEDHITGGRE